MIGAVIELGHCLNMLDHAGLMEMQDAHRRFKWSAHARGEQLPRNKFRDGGGAYQSRALDCAVLEYLHQYRRDAELPAYDTVAGALWEGRPLYENAGITDKNHMQICIRNVKCIRGYFRVRDLGGVDLTRWDQHPQRARVPAI